METERSGRTTGLAQAVLMVVVRSCGNNADSGQISIKKERWN